MTKLEKTQRASKLRTSETDCHRTAREEQKHRAGQEGGDGYVDGSLVELKKKKGVCQRQCNPSSVQDIEDIGHRWRQIDR